MTTSRRSSNASPPLRLELRASRPLAACLLLIGLAAGAGMFLTDLPPAAAVPLSLAAGAWGAVLARAELRRPVEALVLQSTGAVRVDGQPVDAFRVQPRGPLTRLAWTADGRSRYRVAWPDVLDAATRRELRLWALGRDVRASTAAVAP